MRLTVPEYLRGTPLQNWDFVGKVQLSKWPLSHSSDILRYVTLWKYGGTYMDLDFVFRKSLAPLGTNYAGAQYDGYIASGALNFDMDTAGRVAAHLCLRDIERNFQGYSWDQNGPAVITRVLENLCGTKRVANMTRQECLGFAVLPQHVFYVIPYPAWRLLFNPSQSKEAMTKVADSYGVHVWNKMSRQENVTVGLEQAYGLLAAAYCPRVYSNCGSIF